MIGIKQLILKTIDVSESDINKAVQNLTALGKIILKYHFLTTTVTRYNISEQLFKSLLDLDNDLGIEYNYEISYHEHHSIYKKTVDEINDFFENELNYIEKDIGKIEQFKNNIPPVEWEIKNIEETNEIIKKCYNFNYKYLNTYNKIAKHNEEKDITILDFYTGISSINYEYKIQFNNLTTNGLIKFYKNEYISLSKDNFGFVDEYYNKPEQKFISNFIQKYNIISSTIPTTIHIKDGGNPCSINSLRIKYYEEHNNYKKYLQLKKKYLKLKFNS